MNKFITTILHILWFISCVPGYLKFRAAACNTEKNQKKLMLKLIRKNSNSVYGKKYSFSKIRTWSDFTKLPLTEYRNYKKSVENIMKGKENELFSEPALILQPTSGTTSEPKFIPYTKTLRNEFNSGLNIWFFRLFMIKPGLLTGKHYWSISPTTDTDFLYRTKSKIPIGFLNDSEYFSFIKKIVLRFVLAVPYEVRFIKDLESNQYVTLLFLLRERRLRLISVWHPSFILILLKKLDLFWEDLLKDIKNGGINRSIKIPDSIKEKLQKLLPPLEKRFQELKILDINTKNIYSEIWPEMQLISCWKDGNIKEEITELQKSFSGILIQGKGLLATEGIMSIPLNSFDACACAVTSHIIEFQDESGKIYPAWNVKKGGRYKIILTTGGGLYRYLINDIVVINGFYKTIPLFRFAGRSGIVSDSVGEKLHIEHVEEAIKDTFEELSVKTDFAVMVPVKKKSRAGYILLIKKTVLEDVNKDTVIKLLDLKLSCNYYYLHARKIGQLDQPKILPVNENAVEFFRDYMILNKGTLAGTVKIPVLFIDYGLVEYFIMKMDMDQ